MKNSMIFVKPEKFQEALEYIKFIDEEVILNVNFHELDNKTAQRVMDLISGAAFIKGGKIVVPGENMVCIIPAEMEYTIKYKGSRINSIDPRFDEEEEIRPTFRTMT